jgi:hypothetical protein
MYDANGDFFGDTENFMITITAKPMDSKNFISKIFLLKIRNDG